MTSVKPLENTKIFEKIRVGHNDLSHRITMVPTTRVRALPDHSPSDLLLKHYDDRSKTPGTLVTSEATLASPVFGIYENAPGIWTDEQTRSWKKVTDAVHKNKSFIGVQLWLLGRVADPAATKKQGYLLVAPSNIPYQQESGLSLAHSPGDVPSLHVPSAEEIHKWIHEDLVRAAKNALAAGFDYIEVHGAHGYLVDTFLQSVSNKRTDQYGGSIENRARFALEIIDALIPVVGAHRLAIRISPWAKVQGILGADDEVSPVAQFGYLVSELQRRANQGNELAYISVVEPRVSGINDVKVSEQFGSNDFIRSIWKGVVLKAGNFTYDAPNFEQALKDVEDDKTLIGFSRYFTSNPDLVERLRQGHDLRTYERDLFYAKGNWGYNTYTRHNEKSEFVEEEERNRVPQRILA